MLSSHNCSGHIFFKNIVKNNKVIKVPLFMAPHNNNNKNRQVYQFMKICLIKCLGFFFSFYSQITSMEASTHSIS